MPKLYEYFGLIIMFYANEHEPVHVHGNTMIANPAPRLSWSTARSRRFAIRMSPDVLRWRIRRCGISRKW